MASSNGKAQLRDSFQGTLKIFIKDLRDRQGRKRPLTIRSWSTIKDVKDQIQQLLHVPPSAQRLYFGPLLISGKELPNHRSLHDAGIYKSGETLLLDIKGGAANGLNHEPNSITALRTSGVNDICISSSMLDSTPKPMRRIIQQARRALMLGLKPILVLDGSGGTYFMHDARKVKVAVFKPADEEPYAENNPRGYIKQHDSDISLREGIKPGEACLREVAAYLLDHNGFSSVPMTTLAEARHPAFNNGGSTSSTHPFNSTLPIASPSSSSNSSTTPIKKVGSCQEFVYAEDTMDDISPSKLSTQQVHKIAILDIRLMNADRNVANLLVRRKPDNSLELVPIDHGYCLRSVCDVSWFDWCWLDWPQLKEPLNKSSRDYILNLDIDKDVHLLEESLQIGNDAIDFFRASTKILQAGVKAGLTLYDIAVLCCRYDNAGEIPSKLEVLTGLAKDLALSAVKNERWGHATASQAIAEQISDIPQNRNGFASSTSLSKSKSLANFSSFTFDLDLTGAENTPASIPISGSESSGSEIQEEEPEENDNDHHNDQEDCKEWAAGIVPDVEYVQSTFRPRILSEASLESLMSDDDNPLERRSSNGFWRVRPWEDTEVNDTVSWSPSPSPSLRSISSKPDIPSLNQEADDLPHKANVTFVEIDREDDIKHSNHHDDNTLSSSNDNISNEKTTTPLQQEISSLPCRPAGGLVRSKSYSAFSSLATDLGGAPVDSKNTTLSKRNVGIDSNEYRRYFHKFVDLLIERETLVASRRKA